MSCAQHLHEAASDVSASRLLPPATCMGNRLVSEVCLHSSSTFFPLAAILLLMAVASLVPTANLDWMHPVPEPDNLFHADVMARDDIHVMTKDLSDWLGDGQTGVFVILDYAVP
ncbi:hypothetical protein B0H14DRAFT_2588052 [Mycena olivaceomarginata]|nr:hypothetical protein B0H14DRAFT_2588052 [Mycena olivaceomarginata]